MITIRRVARKIHRCVAYDGHFIKPGEVYLEFTAFPGEEACDGLTRPIRGWECSSCATRYGRGHLVALQPCCDCCLSNSNHGPETEHARLCSNLDHRVEPILVDKRSA